MVADIGDDTVAVRLHYGGRLACFAHGLVAGVYRRGEGDESEGEGGEGGEGDKGEVSLGDMHGGWIGRVVYVNDRVRLFKVDE